MSINKNRFHWECMDNHLPDWIEKNEIALHSCMSKEDSIRSEAILDRYNELTNKETSDKEDGFSLYGIEIRKNGSR